MAPTRYIEYMQIKVNIEGWAHACCGQAFSVGDTIKWEMAQLRSAQGDVRFELNDHDELSASGVPVSLVAARVVSIEFADRDYVAAIGDPHEMVESGQPAKITKASHVPAGTDFAHSAIIVALQVHDPESLPPVHDWDPQADFGENEEFERLEAARIDIYRKSELREELVGLIEQLARNYGIVARARFDDLGNASFVPNNNQAASIHWRVDFETDKPRLLAEIARADWEFELDERHIGLLGQIVGAAAEGRITDRRRGWRMNAMSMEMVIELASGQKLKQRQKIEGYFGKGNFGILGAMGDRMTRENDRCAPWH
ncbi:DUF6578 domain-containing protein [Glutamicibacter sp.]|uniref:DUF6578 domain-containing protein n=2 Tax=Glutamicibacter sp. TaxID=1931995 RepID=UPI002B4653BD|nr:DUF6578 domain-containing protein [Glutamicibacter sp.]HJX79678.1 DUF6578 domain-containing protein [Glutamicibacter sp.]